MHKVAVFDKLFTMLNNKDTIVSQLHLLGLSRDEATLYLELLKEPSTHLRLAHATGINRTKVYRLASELERRSLVTRRTDDRGTFLVATDPATLEVQLISQEQKVQRQREAFTALLPMLTPLQQRGNSHFAVHTYEGEDGFKQMLWHELKAKGENLIFGNGTIEDLVSDRRWAEKHRAMTVQTNYNVREIINPRTKTFPFTLNDDFVKQHYAYRLISPEIVRLQNQVVIYNNTVGLYHWRQEQKVGVEIINEAYANMMRDVFEHFWAIGKEAVDYRG